MLQLLAKHTHGVYTFLKGMVGIQGQKGSLGGESTMRISPLLSWVKFPCLKYVWAKIYPAKVCSARVSGTSKNLSSENF